MLRARRDGSLTYQRRALSTLLYHNIPQRTTSLLYDATDFLPLYLKSAIMSTLEDLDDLEREQKEEKQEEDKDKNDKKGGKDGKPNGATGDADAEMKDAEPEEEDDPIFEEIESLSTQDIITRRRLLENDSRIMKSEYQRLQHEKASMNEKIKDNNDKIENNRHVCKAFCDISGG